jgi:hypothetical protein
MRRSFELIAFLRRWRPPNSSELVLTTSRRKKFGLDSAQRDSQQNRLDGVMHKMLYRPGNSVTESAGGMSLAWRTSSYSYPNECVEVASNGRGVLVRDSVAPTSETLQIPFRAWCAFLAATRGL